MGKDKKYWIESGKRVRHTVFDREMVVDKVVKRKVMVKSEGIEKPKHFIDGVRCYWIDDLGRSQNGMFHTRHLELIDREED